MISFPEKMLGLFRAVGFFLLLQKPHVCLVKFPEESVSAEIHPYVRHQKLFQQTRPGFYGRAQRAELPGDCSAGLGLPYWKVCQPRSIIFQTAPSM